MTTTSTPTAAPVWLRPEDCRLDDLLEVVAERTDPSEYPHAVRIEQEVLVYDAATVARQDRRTIQAELARALGDGPGIVVVTGAFGAEAVDRVSAAFDAMIGDQRAAGTAAGDHFARPGANDRVWNALDKLALRDPAAFAAYYGNGVPALVAEAWLGPAYQV